MRKLFVHVIYVLLMEMCSTVPPDMIGGKFIEVFCCFFERISSFFCGLHRIAMKYFELHWMMHSGFSFYFE